jgi:hypothetical protein
MEVLRSMPCQVCMQQRPKTAKGARTSASMSAQAFRRTSGDDMPHARLLAEEDNEFFLRAAAAPEFRTFRPNNEGFDPWQSSLNAPF